MQRLEQLGDIFFPMGTAEMVTCLLQNHQSQALRPGVNQSVAICYRTAWSSVMFPYWHLLTDITLNAVASLRWASNSQTEAQVQFNIWQLYALTYWK